MRLFHVVVPENRVSEVISLLTEMNVSNVAKIHASGMMFMLIFRTPNSLTSKIVQSLETKGVGTEYGIVTTSPVETSKPYDNDDIHNPTGDILPSDQIYSQVARGSMLNFNFIVMNIVSGVVSGVGLATNNNVAIIASMILSPLMKPILATSLGGIIKERRLFFIGLVSEIVGIVISIVIGCLVTIIFLPFLITHQIMWPTIEMTTRGSLSGLISDGVIAAASGVGVGIAVTQGELGGLVGVGIAAALLPPAVNTGLGLTYGIIFAIVGTDDVQQQQHSHYGTLFTDTYQEHFYQQQYNANTSVKDMFQISGVSLALLLLNVVLIWVMAMIVFRVKALKPLERVNVQGWMATLDYRTTRELYHDQPHIV